MLTTSATRSSATPWMAYRKAVSNPRLRLFCLPYAGGSAAFYREWAARLPSAVEVCPVQLPGRERRIAEEPYSVMSSLVRDLVAALQPYLDVPFCFFGHSMGAMIGFEAARELRRLSGPLPVRLYFSGRRAPHLPPREAPIHDLPHDAFIDQLRELNGTPPEVILEPEIMELFLPLLRADIGLCERYDFVAEAPLDVPFTVYGGEHDPDVTTEDLEAWGIQSSHDANVRVLSGDHFFLAKHSAAFLEVFAEDLARTLPPAAACGY